MFHLKENVIIYYFPEATVESLNIPLCVDTMLNFLNMFQTSYDSAENVKSAVGGKW